MNVFELIEAASKHKLITEPKRNGQYRILEISKEECKQQDGSWERTVKYENILDLKVYRRPVSMFNKFSVI